MPGKAPGKFTVQGAVIVHFSRGSRRPRTSPLLRRGRHARSLRALERRPHADLNPFRIAARMIREDSPRATALVATALVASAMVATIDAFLLRGMLDVSRYLALDYQRLGGIGVLLAFTAGGLLLEWFIAVVVHRVGLGLETRLRVAFLEKLPRLEEIAICEAVRRRT